ncbi:hypothetical protein [Pseudomarimonas salicorniae]|uniref:Transmembrane protein n=1 Tax=Pseudomarimonas salicorniae TaxID=2933270 RepID=A0ABT0GGJ7_9GAMM|nr:hypothetical protein [Lysobacter sp. CAU 1642]MCK7593656.1 hypothetical protein [Lysobacter sp. CAU 1642]
MTNPRRSRLTLLLVAAAFLTPFLVAVFLRFGGWQPPQTRNIGELLQPPLPMHEISATRGDDGTAWTFENTEHEWTLLAQLPARCEAECRATLEVLPNVRIALARHAGRLHPFVLGSAPGTELPFPALRLAGELPAPLRLQPETRVQVFLVDPHGFLVMRHAEGFDPNGLRKDLSRLIK